MKEQWFVGLMTGTVLDGQIDVALLRTNGDHVSEFGLYDLVPYQQDICNLLEDTIDAAQKWQFEGPEPNIFVNAERALTLAQAEAVAHLLKKAKLSTTEIAGVGFHGQTVLHRAPTKTLKGQTRQLGDGKLLANQLGVPVVYDFRSADIGVGGQGAPLCPSYHAALLNQAGAGADTAILNLGGVANLTWQSKSGRLIAFDTGPANAPINDWVKSLGLGEMDRDGMLARAGSADQRRLAELLDHQYFDTPFPKSLDRFDFNASMAAGCSAEDGAALLTEFTASAVAKGLELLPHRPTRLILGGGGRRNLALVDAIARRARVLVENADDYGWRGDAIEAECFAYLAARRMANQPISWPDTTGVPKAMTGGRLARPAG